MAAPAYTEDLTDIDLAETGSTGWTAFNISGGGGGAPAFGADLGMQGGGAWDKAANNAERGLAVNKTPGAGTVAAGVHIFQWGFCATPGITDTLVNRGAYVLIGTSTANYMQFHVEGSDTYGALGRVGKCYVVDYHTTPNTGSIPYSTEGGTAGATPTYFGFGLKTIATAKGSNIGADAVRYGTGAYLTAGELLSAGDASDDPASFVGFNAQNDDVDNRWGILTSIGGTSYELQGRFVIGQNNTPTATACSFKDSNVNISLVDTVHSEADFTQIILDHASTWVEWDNINITALGQTNPGRLVVNSANPEFQYTGGTITDIGISTLRSNTTADGVTWRGCGEITANGAILANSKVFHGSKIIDAQDETNYASPSAFDGGVATHVVTDVITLDDGTRITVDAVSTGVVTQFTVDSVLSKVGGAILSQVSTTGSGTGFSLTPDTQNYTESSGLIWNTSADPNGELDGMTFDTLTIPMTHALEFGITSPTTITLTNCVFGTNYSATEDTSVGNETFWFRRGSPDVININLVGCTGNFGYKTDGAIVNIIADPVTTLVTVTDNNQAPLMGARVILEADGSPGILPYLDTVTITSTGNTASVAHTAHGLSDGDKVNINNVNQYQYNGVKTITNQSTNAYDYNIDSPLPTSPAFAGGNLQDAQDETAYDNSPTTEGIFSGGSNYTALDVLTLEKGISATVDTVSSGIVTEFTIDSTGQDGYIVQHEKLDHIDLTGGNGGVLQTGFANAAADTTTITVSPTLVAGTGRKLFVWASYDDTTNITVSGTYDGNNLSIAASSYNNGNGAELLFYYYDIPDAHSGSKDIIMTYNENRTNRAVMYAIVEEVGTGDEETIAGTQNSNINSATLNMTSTSTETIFIMGSIVELSGGEVSPTFGSTEIFQETFDTYRGVIIYEVHTVSGGGDFIGIDWPTNSFAIWLGGVWPYTTLPSLPGSLGFSITPDEDNFAAANITSTGVIIQGLTDSSGQISDSRVFSTSQPVSGRISKGTNTPYFKDAPLSGIIDNVEGLSLSSQLILDE